MATSSKLNMLNLRSFVFNHKSIRFIQVANHSNITEHQKNIMKRGLPKQKNIEGVKNIICVASGKGGVGKSTVATNLAISFANHFNLKTGLLDADIYGPSIPKMMNLSGHEPEVASNNLMIPLKNYNVNCMSMGFLVDEKAPIVWRGLMVMQAIDRLLFKVNWAPLDILVIDLPPGTGDVQLSISQNLKVNGSLIVTTPQEIALLDARRAIEMFKKVDVKLLGLVQNMSSHKCSNCGNIEHIFGKDGAIKMANEIGCQVLGDLPLITNIQRSADSGQPISIQNIENEASLIYQQISRQIISNLDIKQ